MIAKSSLPVWLNNQRRAIARVFAQPVLLPRAARDERHIDAAGLPEKDPGIERALEESARWLGLAQDCSASADGGVARSYSLIKGWEPSYPETTGYIVPTMLAYGKWRNSDKARARAKRMLDWLVSIQLPCGGFHGGSVTRLSAGPVTFNTGQILLGLSSGVREFGGYREPMRRAADWLVATQDADGCWRKHPTPFAKPGEKIYETHVAWGLLEAARIDPNRGYADAALANVRWGIGWQRDNGWIEKCCLSDPSHPLTHTIGYALRGIVEAHRFSGEDLFLQAARKTADGLLRAIRNDGFLAGRLRSDWSGAADWACLTGTVQIACCWLLLYQLTGNTRYRDAAFAATSFVRRTIKVSGPSETRGAIKGSFPVTGGYSTYQYPNWAAKFFMDSSLLQIECRLDPRPRAANSKPQGPSRVGE